MRHLLRIEAIGHSTAQALRNFDFLWKAMGYHSDPNNENYTSHVYEVLGMKFPGGLIKRLIYPKVDYRDSNSVGTRGVFYSYILSDERVYEVHETVSWRRTELYYIRWGNSCWARLDGEEVLDCLIAKDRSVRTF